MSPSSRFARDRSGAIAPLFALSGVVLTGVIGAAVDYSGASSLRSRLQAATDGTDLLLCRSSEKDQGKLKQTAKRPWPGICRAST